MSTDWNIECRKCGYRVIGDDYEVRYYGLAELCASALLVHAPELQWWNPVVTSDGGTVIQLVEIPKGCTHDFEPRNEYGDWATPDMWPDGHPKSMVITSELTGQCTGRSYIGGSRCGS